MHTPPLLIDPCHAMAMYLSTSKSLLWKFWVLALSNRSIGIRKRETGMYLPHTFIGIHFEVSHKSYQNFHLHPSCLDTNSSMREMEGGAHSNFCIGRVGWRNPVCTFHIHSSELISKFLHKSYQISIFFLLVWIDIPV